jgi:hypothetical protein
LAQDEVGERPDERCFHVARRQSVEGAIVGGDQIFREGQLRDQLPQLAPEAAPDLFLVGSEATDQRLGIPPRCGLLTGYHRTPRNGAFRYEGLGRKGGIRKAKACGGPD